MFFNFVMVKYWFMKLMWIYELWEYDKEKSWIELYIYGDRIKVYI